MQRLGACQPLTSPRKTVVVKVLSPAKAGRLDAVRNHRFLPQPHYEPRSLSLMPPLELKVPPPLVAAVSASLIYGAATLLPVVGISPSLRLGAVLVLAAAGVLLDVAALIAFRRAKTTVSPLSPQNSSTVVSSGVYRFTRNPMYLGLTCLLLAWAVYLASAWALLAVPAFMAYLTRFQIKPEERALTTRFGSTYAAYCARVRRWL